MDMAKLTKIADGVASVSKRFDSFLERRKDKRGDASSSKELKALQDEEEKLEGEMAKASGDKADKLETRIRAIQIKIKKLSRDDSARSDTVSASETKAIKEGVTAARAGKKKSDNPYKSDGGGKFNAGELNAMAWRTGFEKATESARSDASKEWEDAKKSWSDKGSVNGFSVGDRIRVKSDTGLSKSEGAGSEAKITHVSTGGLVKVDKRNWVFATHHIEKA